MKTTPHPHEYRILTGAAALLQAAAGTDYYYDVDDAYVVLGPKLAFFAEPEGSPKTLYFVHPGDLVIDGAAGCQKLFDGDFLVTAGVRHEGPELPHEDGYVDPVLPKLRIFEDVMAALHGQEIEGATVLIVNRNLDIDVDGWAVVQVQVSASYSEA